MTAPVYKRQEMISVQSIAARWNMSKSFVYQLIENGFIEAFKFGGTLRVPESVVLKYEESCRTDALCVRTIKRDLNELSETPADPLKMVENALASVGGLKRRKRKYA